MKIGIDASRAFVSQRTGIEEYAFQAIKHLTDKLDQHQVILYVKKGQCELIRENDRTKAIETFPLPDNWTVKEIPYHYLWTQIGLAWEMLVNPVDVLFVPAHTLPWIHPQKSIVTVHGLEYEHCPESYPLISRLFHRFFVKKSCRWASQIIAVSQATCQDLINMYQVDQQKIKVIYNGYEENKELPLMATSPMISSNRSPRLSTTIPANPADGQSSEAHIAALIQESRYLLFIGRLEKRKNVEGMVKAFDWLKQQYEYPGQLLLVGKRGHGYEQIKQTISKAQSKYDIIELGYVSQLHKWQLLAKADLFLFPSLREGFGIPILEAQSLGVPVVTSNFGPMDEVAGNQDILVNPHNPKKIASKVDSILKDNKLKAAIVQKGLENIKRFSWDKSAQQMAEVLTGA